MPADPARDVVVETLLAVEQRDAYANLLLPVLLSRRGLSGRDAAFATELVYGVLRGQGRLDAVLAACVDRPLDRLDPPVRAVLRTGAHALLAMGTPPHAAVSAGVDTVRRAGAPRAAGLVNAVLRRVAAHDLEGWLAHVGPGQDDDPLGALALRHAHPRWVAAAFGDALAAGRRTATSSGGSGAPGSRADRAGADRVGADGAGADGAGADGAGADEAGAELAEALAADDARPDVHLVARPGRCERDTLLEEARTVLGAAEPTRWSGWGVVLPGGDPGRLPLVAGGAAAVQDEGSQLVAAALAAWPVAGPDRVWLDLAAGPGGKAACLQGLLARRAGRDGVLLAADVGVTRAGLVARALRDGPARALAVTADGRAPAWGEGVADRVLLDAPCSGLGALRRRPEARWRRQPSDVPRLAALQGRLLDTALRSVRPGGVVAYVVCSPHLAETRDVVAGAVARAHGEVVQVDARLVLDGVPHLGAGPSVQLWPHRHGTDAMHLSLLVRRA